MWTASHAVDGGDPLRLAVWFADDNWYWDIDHPDVGDICEGQSETQDGAMAAALAAAPGAALEIDM